MVELSATEWAVLIPGLVVVVAVSLRLSTIDWREHRLPDRLTRPLTVFVAMWVIVLGLVAGDVMQGVQALGWGAAAFAVFLAFSFAGLGGGDVKFSAPLGATLGWFGWDSISTALVGLVVSAGVVGIIIMIQGKGRKHRVAYGPYMAFGLLCGIAQGLIA